MSKPGQSAYSAPVERVTIQVTYTEALLAEAILTANHRMKRRGPAWGFVLLPIFFGLALLAIPAVSRTVVGLDPAEWLLVAGLLTLFAVNLVLVQGRALGQIVEHLARTPIYAGTHRIEIDKAGVSVRVGHGYIHMPWSMVDAVVEMRSGLGICYGGQIVPLPQDALPTGMTTEGLGAQLRAWHGG